MYRYTLIKVLKKKSITKCFQKEKTKINEKINMSKKKKKKGGSYTSRKSQRK